MTRHIARSRRAAAIFIAAPLIVAPAKAQEMVRFVVILRGMTVARITMTARDDGTTYAVFAQLQTTSVAAAWRRVRFWMQAEGVWSGDTPAPRRFAEDVDTGRCRSTVGITYSGQTANVLGQSPPPTSSAVPPCAARATVDPLSALWRLTCGGPRATLCNWVLPVWDGVRRSELRLDSGSGAQSGFCSGRYMRIAGFSAEAMNDRQSFLFTGRYIDTGRGFVLTVAEAVSLFGPIRILRRD